MHSRAVALGVSGAMRTFTPAAAFALRGRFGGRARQLALAAAAIELVTDKTPVARQRIDLPSTACRLVSGAACGGATGAAAAFVATHATYRLRRRLVLERGVPDWRVAVCEDVAAVGLAWWASAPALTGARPDPRAR